MNIYVLFSLLLLLAPGGCPIYSIDLSTVEMPNDFQNELTLQSMLSSELHQSRNKLNFNEEPIHDFVAVVGAEPQKVDALKEDPFGESEQQLRSIEDRIRATHYAAASPQFIDSEGESEGAGDSEGEGEGVGDTEPEKDTLPAPPSLQQQPCDVTEQCVKTVEEAFMGSNLFGSYRKRCFSTEEIALMSARKDFELLMPKLYPSTLIRDGTIYTLIKYFNTVNQVMKRMSDTDSRHLLQRAFYDALGGYLKYTLVPMGQVSYYAGRLKLCTVQRLGALYRQCLLVLNTNGNGWKMPEQDIMTRLRGVRIKPLKLDESTSTESDASNCALLDNSCANEDAREEMMIVPLPHLEMEDSNGFLSNIFLPFKHRRIYNLRSPDAAFILVKFYKTLNKCYRFQGLSPKTYNHKLRVWIRENVQLHYRDEMFYPGLGGILQLYEALSCGIKTTTSDQLAPEDRHTFEYSKSHDYDLVPDNEPVHKAGKSPKKTGKAQRTQSKEATAERRQHRMPRQHKNATGDNESTAKPGEECLDCDDEHFVGYITAFLAVLLLMLVLIICCCLHRSSKDSNQKKAPAKPPDPPLETPSKQENASEAVLTKKSKTKCLPSRHSIKPSLIVTPGMSIVSSKREEVFRAPMSINELEQQSMRREDEYYPNESYTSTSSLVCQFPRKFIPIMVKRDKAKDYYGMSKKKQPKAAKIQPCSNLPREQDRERDTERDRSRNGEFNKETVRRSESLAQRPRNLPKETARRSHLEAQEANEKHLRTQGKFKRQEGGLSYVEENEREGDDLEMIRRRGVERSREKAESVNSSSKISSIPGREPLRPSESDSSRNKEIFHKAFESKSSEVRPASVSFKIVKTETETEILDAKSEQPSSPEPSNGPSGSSKNGASWETTYDEDSNSMFDTTCFKKRSEIRTQPTTRCGPDKSESAADA